MKINKIIFGLCGFFCLLNMARATNMECNLTNWKIAYQNVYKSQGKLHKQIYAQDLEAFLQCRLPGKGLAAVFAESAVVQKYEPITCLESANRSNKCEIIDDKGLKTQIKIPKRIQKACDSECSTVIFVMRATNCFKTEKCEFGLPGGDKLSYRLLWIFHRGVMGHYEITTEAAKRVSEKLGHSWSPELIKYISNASRDPDEWAWAAPQAHGQADVDKDTLKLNQSVEEAKEAFQKWSSSILKKAIEACANPKNDSVRRGVYLLGFALHAIQDAVFHGGISNAEHSYVDFGNGSETGVKIDSTVHYIKKKELATQLTEEILAQFVSKVTILPSTACPIEIWSNKNWSESTSKEIRDFTGYKAPDGTNIELAKYVGLSLRLNKILELASIEAKSEYLLGNKIWFRWDKTIASPDLNQNHLLSIGKLLIIPILKEMSDYGEKK